ncbi:hypothetical protein MXD62_29850, partial [Frankia sp. Mgl5]|nr:hypothetical protein [Frankia sp. Mgl5]
RGGSPRAPATRSPAPAGATSPTDRGYGLDPTGKLMAVYELSAEPLGPSTTFSCAIPEPRLPAAANTRCDGRRFSPGAP